MRIAPLVVASLFLLGCGKKSRDGLPPAQDWSGGQVGEAKPLPQGSARGSNPHAMGANPHADMGGMPPGHPPTDPDLPPGHPPMTGGAPTGPDVTQMGLSAPDPSRKIDPSRRIRGTIKVDAKAKSNVK